MVLGLLWPLRYCRKTDTAINHFATSHAGIEFIQQVFFWEDIVVVDEDCLVLKPAVAAVVHPRRGSCLSTVCCVRRCVLHTSTQ